MHNRYPYPVAIVLLIIDLTVSVIVQAADPTERTFDVEGAKTRPARRVALLIGVNDYIDARDLRYAVADTRSLKQRLMAAGFQPEDIICMTSDAAENELRPTKRMVDRQFDADRNGTFLARIREGDLALVALSGHGVETGGKPYFCPIDAEKEEPAKTMVSIDMIYQRLAKSKARFKLVMIDACRDDPNAGGSRSAETQKSFDGFSKSLDASAKTAGQGIMIMASCATGQKSYEDSKIGHGVFMHHLMMGLTGDADRQGKGNGDGKISLLELYGYAAKETRLYASRMPSGGVQTPVLKGEFTDFDFTDTKFLNIVAKLTVRLQERGGPTAANVPVAIVRRDAFNRTEERLSEGRSDKNGQIELRIPREKVKATDTVHALISHFDRITRIPLNGLDAQPQRDLIAELPTDFTNSIGTEFKLIPAGEFMMGSKLSPEEVDEKYPGSEASYYKDEHPRHRVCITRPIYVGVYEVTVGDFKKFVVATGYKTTAEKEGSARAFTDAGKWDDVKGRCWREPGFPQQDTHPVTCVSWHDATAYCEWLSKKEGRTYRLPTEAEWEYSCRAGTSSVFCWGDDADDGKGHLNGAGEEGSPNGRKWSIHFDFDDGYTATAPAGTYRPNAFGLCDMHGNVYEWCQDWYAEDYYENSPTDDPTGPTTGANRVFRGGSWDDCAGGCRSANRRRYTPGYRLSLLGFRIALVPSE